MLLGMLRMLWPQVKNVEGAGADSAATNGGQVFRVNGDFFGVAGQAQGRLVVSYGPASTPKYFAGAHPRACSACCGAARAALWTSCSDCCQRRHNAWNAHLYCDYAQRSVS